MHVVMHFFHARLMREFNHGLLYNSTYYIGVHDSIKYEYE